MEISDAARYAFARFVSMAIAALGFGHGIIPQAVGWYTNPKRKRGPQPISSLTLRVSTSSRCDISFRAARVIAVMRVKLADSFRNQLIEQRMRPQGRTKAKLDPGMAPPQLVAGRGQVASQMNPG
jgi:hypothetical protein